jgi:16S rRNA (guanine966-N2)-methyltransferase
MIRITGGEAKGRSLKVYKGGSVRPTSDKVRQALFNILEHRFDLDIDEGRCLDLFAGSGSLGAEFLSRGGSELCAVEYDRATFGVLRDNMKLMERSLSHREVMIETSCQRVDRYLNRAPASPFDLVFADPPYRDHLAPSLLAQLSKGWVNGEGLVIIEHEKRDLFIPDTEWVLEDRRSYGDTLISFIRPSPSEL